VAPGATILERHLTDSRYRKGPDISCSMDPAQPKFLNQRSKENQTAPHNQKQRTGPEEDVYRFARASIVADRDLEAGTILKSEDIWARRPGPGEIPGFEFDNIVGRRLRVAKTRNQQLKWSDLETE